MLATMEDVSVDTLNKVLHSSLVAEHAYRALIKSLEKSSGSPVIPLRVLLHEHRTLQKELSAEVRRLGGEPDHSAGIGGFLAETMEELAAHSGRERALRFLRQRDVSVLRAGQEALPHSEGTTTGLLRNRVIDAVHRNLRLLDVLIEAEIEEAA